MGYRVKLSKADINDMPDRIKRTKKPNGRDWLIFGAFLKRWQDRTAWNQQQMANWFGISVRRLQKYLHTTKEVWSGEAKRYIYESPEIFDFTKMDKLTRRRWTNKRSLVNEISRHLNAKPERKRYERNAEKIDPNYHYICDALRHKYGTKVIINENSIELFHFGMPAHEQRLIEDLLK